MEKRCDKQLGHTSATGGLLKKLALFILLLSAANVEAQQRSRVMLAVFAHPDDETTVSPVLARYAREGAKVYLAIATKGEKGANEHAGIPAGDALAKVRREEIACACKQLGIEPPILFELNDGELGAITNPLGQNIQAVADNVEKLIAKLNPQVVITWGPEGGYGHPDHRLVSDAVTQVVQSLGGSVKLVYPGLTAKQLKTASSIWPEGIHWHATDASYLTVRVPFTQKDQAAYHSGLECHKSQFTAEQMQKMEKAFDAARDGVVAFRPWFGNWKANDLFQ